MADGERAGSHCGENVRGRGWRDRTSEVVVVVGLRLSAIMCLTSSAVWRASGQSQLPWQSLSTSGLSL